ncbi:MAG: hypothetical protein SGI97_05680 [candidate division Zixibacteria bacterium]|nr:hypothetical protein [candidate division Zixibacteria bacterium]
MAKLAKKQPVTVVEKAQADKPLLEVRRLVAHILVTYGSGKMIRIVSTLSDWLISPPPYPIVIICHDKFTEKRIQSLPEIEGIKVEIVIQGEHPITKLDPCFISIPPITDRAEDLPLITSYCVDASQQTKAKIDWIALEVLAFGYACVLRRLKFGLDDRTRKLTLDEYVSVMFELCDRARDRAVSLPFKPSSVQLKLQIGGFDTIPADAYDLKIFKTAFDVTLQLTELVKMPWWNNDYERECLERKGEHPGHLLFGECEAIISEGTLARITTQNVLDELGLLSVLENRKINVSPKQIQAEMLKFLQKEYRQTLLMTETDYVLEPYSTANQAVKELPQAVEKARGKVGLGSPGASPKGVKQEQEIFLYSPDYKSVRIKGQLFTLTYKQAQVIAFLHELWLSGTPSVSVSTVRNKFYSIGSEDRLKRLFRAKEAWDALVIRGERRGSIRLNMDQPPISPR